MIEPTHELDEAINIDRKALALRPTGHVNRSDILHNLAIRLHSRYEQTEQM